MDIHCNLNGVDFVWNDRKAISNKAKHEGIGFEQAATVFFDPLFASLMLGATMKRGTL